MTDTDPSQATTQELSPLETAPLKDAAPAPRIAVLVSGRGSNLQALIDAIERGDLHAQIALVICNHAGAPALERAASRGIPTRLIVRRDYASREEQQQAMLAALLEARVALVVLAAANRDPAVNPHPERFDVGRRDRRIFTFGAGVHACPGDALAALIAQAGVEALMIFRRDLASLIKPVSYRPSANVRIALLGNR